MNSFNLKIREVFGVKESELNVIRSHFTTEQLKKNDFLVKKEQFCEQLIFLTEGYFRVYNLYNEKEITQWIAAPSYFLTDLAGFFYGDRSRWNIQALTDVSFFTITTENYKKLQLNFPNWEQIEKRFIGHCFISLEERVNQLISLSTEERYRQFYLYNKKLFNKVPLQHIASMLGMTPETLSRIRKKEIS